MKTFSIDACSGLFVDRLSSKSLVVLAMLLFGFAGSLMAESYTWVGGGTDTNWGTSGNWVSGQTPDGSSSQAVVINFAGSTGGVSNNNYGSYTQFQQIEFLSGAASYTLNGNPIKLYNWGGAAKVENLSTNLQTVNTLIDFVGQGELDPTSGDLTIGGNVYVDNGGEVRVWGGAGHVLTLNGSLNNGSGTADLVDETNNIVILNNSSNSYTGYTTVYGGELRIGPSGTINTTSQVYLGGTNAASTATTSAMLTLGGTGQSLTPGITVQSGAITLNSMNVTGTNTVSGLVTLQTGLTVTGSAGGTLNITGQVTAGSLQTLTKAGPGTLLLGGSVDNTNLTAVVSGGTLVLNKSSSASVHAVGNGGGSTALTINAGATAQLGGSGGDQIYNQSGVVANGTFDLNGNSEGFEVLSGSGTVTNSSSSTPGTLTLGAANVVGTTGTFGGVFTDTGTAGALSLIKSGSSTLVLSSTASTFHGSTTITNGGSVNNGLYQGGLIIAGDGSLGTAPSSLVTNAITLDGANLTVSGSNVQIAATRGITVTSNGGTLTDSGGSTSLNLTVNSPVVLQTQSGSQHLFIESSASTTLNGVVSGSGDIVKEGGGTLTLSASNTFGNSSTGANLYVDSGTVQTGMSGGFGVTSGTVGLGPQFNQANSGNTQLSLTTAGTNIANPILNVRYYSATSNFSKTIGSSITSGTATYSGPVILNDNVTLSSSAGGTTAFSGVISQGTATGGQTVNGSPGITVAGSGAVLLSNDNTYSGATAVNSGTLLVTGSLGGTGSVSVAAGASLEVDGLLNHGATTTVNNGTLQGLGSTGAITANGGTIAPGLTVGDSQSATGTLTAAGAVTLSSTTTFSIRVGVVSGVTGDNDQLAVNSGSVALDGAALQLTIGGALNNPADINNTYIIINGNAGATGANGDIFAGQAEGSTITTLGGYQFTVDYASSPGGGALGSGNDVVLQLAAIPEPATWTGLVFGAFAIAACRRRRVR